MLKTLGASAVVLGVVLSATPAFCYTITPLGLLTGDTGDKTRAFKHDFAANPIEDYYSFSTNKTANISASIINSFSTSDEYINGFTIELFKGLPPVISQLVALASNGAIASGTTTDANNPPDSESAKLKALGQMAGNYYLKVTGTTAGLPSYSGSLAIAITTVPLPASAPMFGAAVLALGLAGYGLKRKKSAASV